MLKNITKLIIYTDGGSRGNPGKSGGGVYVVNQASKSVLNLSLFFGNKTNNEAEYLAFLASLKWLEKQIKQDAFEKLKTIDWLLDSKLVVEQINKNWKIKEERLQKLVNRCWKILETIPYSTNIKHVLRDKNEQADFLANLAMDIIS